MHSKLHILLMSNTSFQIIVINPIDKDDNRYSRHRRRHVEPAILGPSSGGAGSGSGSSCYCVNHLSKQGKYVGRLSKLLQEQPMFYSTYGPS